jgi:CelD/BcsL family acetyltransferase involved in cellulose biosynthesis
MGTLTTSPVADAVACVPLVEALDLGAAVWDGLLECSPAAAPFAGWAWHQAWAHSAPREDLEASHAVLLRDRDGDVAALLPVGIRRLTFRRRCATALTWAIEDVGCPDHLDVPARADADLAAMIPALLSLPWDVLILNNVAAAAVNAPRLAAALRHCGATVRQTPVWSCPYLDLPPTWDAYLASLSANRRQRLRREERRLVRDHTVVRTDYDTKRFEEGWRHLVSLHELRWAGAGVFSDARLERLHRNFAEAAARRGELWLTTLDVDGQPAAAWYGFAHRDTVYFYQSGRDPRWERQGVGLVLMTQMIRHAIERGYRRFDFLRGDEAYKGLWTASHRRTVEFVIFRPGWRGLWLRSLDLAGLLRARILGRRAARV